MRLFGTMVQPLTKDIIDTLMQREMIEFVEQQRPEVEADVRAVFDEYLRTERNLTEKAKDLAQARGLSFSDHNKIKRQLAEEQRFGLYEESVGYLATQILEVLLHSNHVEEIFAEDHEIRTAIMPVLRRRMGTGNEIEAAARKQLRNLKEGTLDWEIRYRQEMERLQRSRE